MAIGIDLDEILFPFVPHLCGFLNFKYDLNLSEKDFFSYQFWKVYNVPMQQTITDIDEFCETKAFKRIEPFPFAREGLKQLKELDDLAVVTSRNSFRKKHTENQIEHFFPGLFSKIVFGNAFSNHEEETTKRELCSKNNIWLMIEDCFSYALDISKDIPVIVPGKPWNLDVYGSNMLRLNDSENFWLRIPLVARELDRNPYCLL